MKAKTTATIGTAAGIVLIMGIFATNDIVGAMKPEPSATASHVTREVTEAKPLPTETSKPTPSATPTPTATVTPSESGTPQALATDEPLAVTGSEISATEPQTQGYVPQTVSVPVTAPQPVTAPTAPAHVSEPVQTPVTAPTCTSWNNHSCEPGNPGPTGTPTPAQTFTPCPTGVNNTDPSKCGTVWVDPNPGHVYVDPNPGTPTGPAAQTGPSIAPSVAKDNGNHYGEVKNADKGNGERVGQQK